LSLSRSDDIIITLGTDFFRQTFPLVSFSPMNNLGIVPGSSPMPNFKNHTNKSQFGPAHCSPIVFQQTICKLSGRFWDVAKIFESIFLIRRRQFGELLLCCFYTILLLQSGICSGTSVVDGLAPNLPNGMQMRSWRHATDVAIKYRVVATLVPECLKCDFWFANKVGACHVCRKSEFTCIL
jgi:hypothetical protein